MRYFLHLYIATKLKCIYFNIRIFTGEPIVCKASNEETQNKDTPYYCNICFKYFKKVGNSSYLSEINHNLPSIFDVHFIYLILQEYYLNQHLKTHDGKKWNCDECGKMFSTKYFLKKHKHLHTG